MYSLLTFILRTTLLLENRTRFCNELDPNSEHVSTKPTVQLSGLPVGCLGEFVHLRVLIVQPCSWPLADINRKMEAETTSLRKIIMGKQAQPEHIWP